MASREPPRRVRLPMVSQQWRSVGFVHWPCAPHAIGPLVPEPLVVDTYDGAAWMSMTPFSTTCEVLGAVGVPGAPRFPETNVRTYVRGPDGRDGLLFLSLEVTNHANAFLGRLLGLPYRVAAMEIDDSDANIYRYRGSRDASPRATYDIALRPTDVSACAPLDVFLTGRWSAYVRFGRALLRFDVEHEPWPLRRAELVHADTAIATAVGAPDATRPMTAHFAHGVSARIAGPAVRFCRPAAARSSDSPSKEMTKNRLGKGS